MAAAPVLATVDSLRPGTKGHNLVVQVVDAKTVIERSKGPKGTPLRVAECIVGDSTGVIVLIARNAQVDVATKGAFLTLTNAKLDMFRGSMRLVVDGNGKMEVAEGESFSPKMENNLSLIEYEMVAVPAPGSEVTAA